MAKLVPGKEEFYETLRYFSKKIQLTGVDVRLNTKVDADHLLSSDPSNSFDAVILATGVLPRQLSFEGSDHPKVSCQVLIPPCYSGLIHVVHSLPSCDLTSLPLLQRAPRVPHNWVTPREETCR